MTKPLVTIGLTTFNTVNTVERVLNSALEQTWRPLEVVAVDDCSSDGTRELLQQLLLKHSELRVFGNAINSGVAVSRNRILAEARGEFVAFFDDDDHSLEERIAMQFERIVTYERQFSGDAPVICHATRRLRYPDGHERVERTMGQNKDRRAPAGLAVAHRILMGKPLKDGNGACPTCSQMARLSTYNLLGGFDPIFRRGEDTDFNIRLALAGGHFVGIDNPLVIQKMTKTSDKSLQAEFHYMRRLLEKHKCILQKEGQFKFCCDWLSLKQCWLERKKTIFAKRLFWLSLTRPILTARRISMALRNIGVNRAFRRFHAGGK